LLLLDVVAGSLTDILDHFAAMATKERRGEVVALLGGAADRSAG